MSASIRPSASPAHPDPAVSSAGVSAAAEQDAIDLRDLFIRFIHGLPQTIGLAMLGLVLAAAIWLVASPFRTVTTTARVTFSFPGFGKGQYPDHSKFQPDDLRAPDIVAAALKRQGLDGRQDYQTAVRAALTIEGVIPPDVIRDRDRLIAAGQNPAPYVPDEYQLILRLPRKYPLTVRQRQQLLSNIVTAYEEKFEATYAQTPRAFGNAFATLKDADYPEYEFVLEQEIQNITDFLNQQIGPKASDASANNTLANAARTFRSRTTGYSFSDLLEQTRLFSQIQLNETLGLIYQYGLSRNRATALVKMDYFLRTLDDQDQQALQDQSVVDGLLAKAQEHAQGYVLGIKSAAASQGTGTPIIDQGLIDSLLANDAYNFLVRRALDAGLTAKKIEAQKARLVERRKNLEEFLKKPVNNQAAIMSQVQASLKQLKEGYDALISNIRQTYSDFARQQYADAIRLTMQPHTSSHYAPMFLAGLVGACLGLIAGMGLSLLGIYIGRK